jgi:hypothetical protein
LPCKLLGRIERVVDFPFKLVYERMLAKGYIKLDQYPHFVVLESRVGLTRVQRLVVEKGVRVIVLHLLVDLAINLLHNILAQFGRYLKVLDKGLGE